MCFRFPSSPFPIGYFSKELQAKETYSLPRKAKGWRLDSVSVTNGALKKQLPTFNELALQSDIITVLIADSADQCARCLDMSRALKRGVWLVEIVGRVLEFDTLFVP